MPGEQPGFLQKMLVLDKISEELSSGISIHTIYSILVQRKEGSDSYNDMYGDVWHVDKKDIVDVGTEDVDLEAYLEYLNSKLEITGEQFKLDTLAAGDLTGVNIKAYHQDHVKSLIEYTLHAKKTLEKIKTESVKDFDIENFCEDVEKVFNNYFTLNNCDYTWTIEKDRVIGEIKVFFPEKNVENSNGRKHTIKNVYCRINCNIYLDYSSSNNPIIDFFSQNVLNKGTDNIRVTLTLSGGARTKLSEAEYNSGYVFSHFSQYRGTEWSRVCLGGDATTLTKYNSPRAINKSDLEHYTFGFCVALDRYLEWESLEGGPYIKISQIPQTSTPNISEERLDKYFSFNENSLFHLLFDDYENPLDNYIIDVTENGEIKFGSALEKKLQKIPLFYNNGDVVSPKALLKYYQTFNIDSVDKNQENIVKTVGSNFFNFKGKLLGRLQVYANQTDLNSLKHISQFEEMPKDLLNVISSNIKNLIQYEFERKKIQYTKTSAYSDAL